MSIFNIQSYLEDRDIEYWTKGKNVSAGWTTIRCPFEFCPDHSNHCGINPQGIGFNCYICGETGHITKLIKEIDKCSWQKANKTYRNFSQEIPNNIKKKIILKQITKTNLPKNATPNIPRKAKNYLIKRRFSPDYIINKYRLQYGGIFGRYKFRLIVPFYLNGRLITFSSIDITNEQIPKYKHQKIEDTIIDPSRTLYNIDSVKDKMILVEGITDVWRIGDGCCATMGKTVSQEQLNIMYKKRLKKVLVMFDFSDAMDQSKKIATQLSGFGFSVEHVECINTKINDPDDLPDNIVKKLRKNFF